MNKKEKENTKIKNISTIEDINRSSNVTNENINTNYYKNTDNPGYRVHKEKEDENENILETDNNYHDSQMKKYIYTEINEFEINLPIIDRKIIKSNKLININKNKRQSNLYMTNLNVIDNTGTLYLQFLKRLFYFLIIFLKIYFLII